MMAEMTVQREVCERLDELVVDFFTTLTSLYSEQNLLQQSIKSGFLNMSRARYSMGIKSVDIHKIDENKLRASVKVRVSDANDTFKIEDVNDLETQLSDLDISSDNKPGSEPGIRRRKQNTEADTDKLTQENGDSKDVPLQKIACDSNKVADPIKGFGILVPPALKQSQKDFRNTVNIAISVANLKAKLQILQQEYASLLRKKEQC